MSYILDSIKQAERERKVGKVPTLTVEYVTPQHNEYSRDWKNWTIVTLGIILLIISIWLAVSTFSANTYINYLTMDTSSLNVIEEDNLVEEQFNKLSSDKEINENSNFLKSEIVHNSQLKSVNLLASDNSVLEDKKNEDIKITNVEDIENSVELAKYESKELPVKLVSDEKIQEQNVSSGITSDGDEAREKLENVFNELSDNSDGALPVYYEADDLNRDSNTVVQMVSTDQYNSQSKKDEVDNIKHEIKAINSGVSDFGQLPYIVQEKIPEMEISVHMFHEDPVQRRVRIDGRMYTEGTNLESGLVLKEITRYGVIFEFQEHKFRINLR